MVACVQYTLGLRLLCLVVDVKTCDPSIVANAFYVLGMIVGELQNIFYQLQAVDLICDILRASYRYDKKWGNEVVGYACLTLASLCAQHLENTAIIVEDTRLIQLVVRILDQRASFHDDLGIHGASALLCNLLYKNDVARTRFGYVDVCQVLVKVRAFACSNCTHRFCSSHRLLKASYRLIHLSVILLCACFAPSEMLDFVMKTAQHLLKKGLV